MLAFLLKPGDNLQGVDPLVFDEMTAAIKDDRAMFWPVFFKGFSGVRMRDQPVSNEAVHWACSVSMQAGLEPTLACTNGVNAEHFSRAAAR